MSGFISFCSEDGVFWKISTDDEGNLYLGYMSDEEVAEELGEELYFSE